MTSKDTGTWRIPTVEIPTYWTPEQAAAVFEFIHEIREQIWSVHGLYIQDEIQRQISPGYHSPDPDQPL